MQPLTLRQHTFTWGAQTYIMGIINVTPDSFSGDGLVRDEAWVQAAIDQGRRFVAEGAHFLDVGGESTRPGSQPVDVDEELRRVLPVIEGLAKAVDVPISVDTSKAVVAQAALQAGASLVNDVWGLRLDPPIAEVAARAGAPVILMHNRSKREHAAIDPTLGGRYVGTDYGDLIEDIRAELAISLDLAHRAGILDEHIILDPGIGFGKIVAQNLELLDRLGELRGLGYPLLVGPSRKSFIGYTLDLPPEQRTEGTAAAVAIAIARGADIVRVHDVQAMARVAKMTDAIVRRLEDITTNPGRFPVADNEWRRAEVTVYRERLMTGGDGTFTPCNFSTKPPSSPAAPAASAVRSPWRWRAPAPTCSYMAAMLSWLPKQRQRLAHWAVERPSSWPTWPIPPRSSGWSIRPGRRWMGVWTYGSTMPGPIF